MIGRDVTIRPGSPGQYDVLVDGTLVASKEKVGLIRKLFGDGGFPDEDATVEAVRATIAGATTARNPAPQ